MAQASPRPVFHKRLGAYFRDLREAQGWKQAQAADLARRRGLKALTRQVLLRLEKGATKFPQPDVLRDLSTLYGVEYPALVATVTEHAYGLSGRDLPRQTSTTDSSSTDASQEGTPHGAQAGLVKQRDDLIASLFEIEATVTAQLATLIDTHPEIGTVARRHPRQRRHHRAGRR